MTVVDDRVVRKGLLSSQHLLKIMSMLFEVHEPHRCSFAPALKVEFSAEHGAKRSGLAVALYFHDEVLFHISSLWQGQRLRAIAL